MVNKFRDFSVVLILTFLIIYQVMAEQATVSIPSDLRTTPGATDVQVPVNVTDLTGLDVISTDITLRYDSDVLTATGATLDGTIASGDQIVSNIDDAIGEIRIALTITNPLIGSGVLVFISFDVASNPPTNTSGLSLFSSELNEGEVTVEINNGKIVVSCPPTVMEINPLRGPVAGGTPITITGENFIDAATVTIGGNDATHLVFVDATQLTARTPEGVEGIAEVVVTNPDYQSGTLPDGFTYVSDKILAHRIITAGETHEFSLFNLTLIIPASAITTDKTLEVEIPENTAPLLGGLHEMSLTYDLHFIGKDSQHSSVGLSFAQPLTLIFHYQEEMLPPNVEEESLRVYLQEEGLWTFVGGLIDTQKDIVTVEINHFSTYSLLAGYAYGDVTGNGLLTAFDAAIVLQKVAGIISSLPSEHYPAFREKTGDVSGDGTISAFDATLILRKVVGLSPDPLHPDSQKFPVEKILQNATQANLRQANN